MKKMMSFVLALLMVCLLSISAFAESANNVEELSSSGVTITIPDAFVNAKGLYSFSEYGAVADGIQYIEGIYVAITADAYVELMEKDELTDEEISYVRGSYAPLLSLLTVNGNREASDIADFLDYAGFPQDALTKVGEAGEYNFFLYVPDPVDVSSYGEEFQTEYETLFGLVPEMMANASYYEPVDPYADTVGSKVSFTTTDINGNPVDSAELFAANDITMVNIWCSWCNPCIGELEELEAINANVSDINCAVIGLLYDGTSDDAIATAKGLMEEHGVTYPVLLPPENVDSIFAIEAFPTSYFVNSEGIIVNSPIVGAQVDAYEPAIRNLQAGEAVEIEQNDQDAVTANDANSYRIYVADENGNPVAGVAVQFCSDNTCMLAKTDENGLASYSVDPGTYTVHILKVPAGYAKDTNEYKMLDTYSDLSVVLHAE